MAAQLEVGTSGDAALAEGGGTAQRVQHSTPSDMLAVLRQQLEEKDRLIADLRVSSRLQGCKVRQAGCSSVLLRCVLLHGDMELDALEAAVI